MHRGQLAKLPAADGRRAERRVVNLAAGLREPGAAVSDAEVLNLSETGFMATSELELQVGQIVFLKLTGLEPQKSQVVWLEGKQAGFQFSAPLHPAELNQITATGRKGLPKNHFGSKHFGR